MLVSSYLNATDCDSLALRLINWFTHAARQLPWRNRNDAYGIWISEIMLQQTQVATVVDYWNRWMIRFPTVVALAAAEESEVFEVWQGLGYYSRARNIMKAAQVIVNERHGEIPGNHAELLDLPGIGPYTAGAIASIAFGLPKPLLDGNVTRVLCRLLAIQQDAKATSTQKLLWKLAEQLVETANGLSTIPKEVNNPCGTLNQALMELGATVCTPKKPRCPACPVGSFCRANKTNTAESFPVTIKKAPPTVLHFQTLVLFQDRSFLMRQAPKDARWNQGLWEFPRREISNPESLNNPHTQGYAKRSAPVLNGEWEFADDFIKITEAENNWNHLGSIRHSITRFKITLQVYMKQLDCLNRPPATGRGDSSQEKLKEIYNASGYFSGSNELRADSKSGWRWTPVEEVEKLPLSSAQRKIARLAMQRLDSPFLLNELS